MEQSRSSTATQHALAQTKQRQLLEKARLDEIADRKKAIAEKAALEERKKERERKERERLEEETKRMEALPKTRNLWELKREREKRGLDKDGRDDHLLAGKTKVSLLLD